MPAEITREHYEYSLSPFICKQVLLPIPLPGGVVMDGDTAQVAPNKDAIFQHLEALFHPRYELPTGLWFEIVWGEPIDDGALSNTKHFSPLQLNEAAEFAFEKSKAGNNVYVSPGLRKGVAAGKSNRANSTNFARSNWAWAEFDGEGDAERIQTISDEKELRPDTVVMTGRTPHIRAHLYFRLDKAVTSVDELKAANEGLQTLLGTDPAVKDVVRVLRLAGTVNYPPPKKVKRGYVKERVHLHRPPAPEYTAAHLAGLGGGNAFEARGEKKPRRTPDDIIALLEKTKTPGQWHNNMLVVTASLVGKGWDDEAIQTACHTYCKDGANDPDLIELIVSARKKFNKSEEEAQRRNEQRAVNVKIGEKPLEPNLPVILTIPEMEDRLVLTSSGAVVDRATGRVRKKENRADTYAASVYVPEGKNDVAQCLPVWIKSKGRKEVDALVWVPGGGEFCKVPEKFGGHTLGYNIWRGLEELLCPENWEVQVQPFIDHVSYLVPVKAECDRFLLWLGHIVQCPEVLPHTYYLMIAEKQGIGRNLLASILVRVLRGHVAASMSISDLLDEKFNGRLSQKLLFIVDEMQEGSGAQRYQRENKLRSVITQEIKLINQKYGVQSIEKNCCRGLMFSNHYDAIPLDNYDRRAQIIMNPEVPKEAAYYRTLYGLLDDHMFIGSVYKYLTTLDMTLFNPGDHATKNLAKELVIDSTKSIIDRVIDEFLEEWKRPLALRGEIIERVPTEEKNSKHISNALSRAGLRSTGRRIWDENNKRQEVIIVEKGQWTVERVKDKNTTAEVLMGTIRGRIV